MNDQLNILNEGKDEAFRMFLDICIRNNVPQKQIDELIALARWI